MASASTRTPCCILLVYGIPGSGKSMLTDHLCSESVGYSWSMLPIHFDTFYPSDTRVTPMPNELEDLDVEHVLPFGMKQTRLKVIQCIERFIQEKILHTSSEGSTPQLWDTFVVYLRDHRHWETEERCCHPSPLSVLVLDDNFHLRSMRYHFYQLARKYQFGFAEVCICCDVTVAQARNNDREIPIPRSTILSMERRLELPEPTKYHWEKRSSVLFNNSLKEGFLIHAQAVVRELVTEALANPEHQITPEDSEMKEMCRLESLESYLHQADIILRKCVSTAIQKCKDVDRGKIAKLANFIRREVLDEFRAGGVVEQCQGSQLLATSSEYEEKLRLLYQSKLDSQLCHIDLT